jgi:hypothetical protein
MTQIRSTLAVALFAAAATSASAATVNLTANNGIGTSGFNAATGWSPAGAPSAGNDYVTQGFLLRTPSAAGSYTFAGDSLLVGGGVGGGAFTPGLVNNNSFLNKTPSGAVITVNNMILNASAIRDGQSSVENWTLQGNLLVTGLGGNLAAQETFNLNSVISGSAPLYIADFGNTDVGRIVKIGSSLNTYNGTITMMGTAANRSRLTFIDNSLMNFTIGASGINNAINRSGALSGTLQLDGDFGINLSGAGNTIGDNWLLVDNANLAETYSSTFTVLGFSDIGGDIWQTSANGATYQFSEGTGILSVVPEPASASLLVAGAAALIAQRRARRA